MRLRPFIALTAVIALGAIAQPLTAGAITYVESGEISGFLDSAALNDTPFTFTFYGDTSGIFNFLSSGVLLNPATSNNIEIGASNGWFTDAVVVGVNPSIGPSHGIVGFSSVSLTAGITFEAAGAFGYNLATPISVSDVPAYGHYASGPIATNLGELTITDARNLAFTATLGAPEPSALFLCAAAFTALLFARHWRKRAA